MSGRTEHLEKKLDNEIKSLNEMIHSLCEENTNMQREIIQREKELIANISNLIASSVFKRAFTEKEGTKIKKTFDKNNLCIGSSLKTLINLKEKIEKGIGKRRLKEDEHLKMMGIDNPELVQYNNLFSSDVFLDYYFGTHKI
ncbi:hypothetical protein [uncultured Ruminococcus sp.]|jgi:hypothetical protein|uniref:hypothetical protein n=1 Tax=uncultured Ruminococcus sp. TaxID=165186 RepID=UPI0025FE1CC5|nr:hypothetical protein [uncultured Ruminococcus sp.]